MGRSEWAFPINSKEDVEKVLSFIILHNNLNVSEDLEAYCILQNKDTKQYYLCVGNDGGREQTSQVLAKYYPKHNNVLLPFSKPKWYWDDTKITYFWQKQSKDDELKHPW
jgi:hypothetical protein